MNAPSTVSWLRAAGSVAIAAVVAAAVAVLLLPTPSNAAAIGVRDNDVCAEKCRDRHAAEALDCNIVTIQVPGTLGNKSISQETGEALGDRVDIRAACLLRAEANLAACIDDCDSRALSFTGRGAISRSSYSVQRSR